MTPDLYTFKVINVIRVLDGDTYHLHLDVGFRLSTVVEIRLHGFDTPEKRGVPTAEKNAAHDAMIEAARWLQNHLEHGIYVRTEKTDDFGRWLGDVYNDAEERLGAHLRSKLLASQWPQKWREEFG